MYNLLLKDFYAIQKPRRDVLRSQKGKAQLGVYLHLFFDYYFFHFIYLSSKCLIIFTKKSMGFRIIKSKYNLDVFELYNLKYVYIYSEIRISLISTI